MAKLTDEEIHQKILELDEQLVHLTEILTIMIDKMDRIEQTTVKIGDEVREELVELKEELDIDVDRKS